MTASASAGWPGVVAAGDDPQGGGAAERKRRAEDGDDGCARGVERTPSTGIEEKGAPGSGVGNRTLGKVFRALWDRCGGVEAHRVWDDPNKIRH